MATVIAVTTLEEELARLDATDSMSAALDALRKIRPYVAQPQVRDAVAALVREQMLRTGDAAQLLRLAIRTIREIPDDPAAQAVLCESVAQMRDPTARSYALETLSAHAEHVPLLWETLWRYAEPLLTAEQRGARALATALLRPHAGRAEVQPALIRRLVDPSAAARKHALQALAPYAERPEVQLGIAELLADGECAIRNLAANALASPAIELHGETLAVLRRRVDPQTSSVWTRRAVEKVLAAHAERNSGAHQLLEVLAQDPDGMTRERARSALYGVDSARDLRQGERPDGIFVAECVSCGADLGPRIRAALPAIALDRDQAAPASMPGAVIVHCAACGADQRCTLRWRTIPSGVTAVEVVDP